MGKRNKNIQDLYHYVDLDPNVDHLIQIKKILNHHTDWYLITYHFANHRMENKSHHKYQDQNHLTAIFLERQYCTPINNRCDGLRWAVC